MEYRQVPRYGRRLPGAGGCRRRLLTTSARFSAGAAVTNRFLPTSSTSCADACRLATAFGAACASFPSSSAATATTGFAATVAASVDRGDGGVVAIIQRHGLSFRRPRIGPARVAELPWRRGGKGWGCVAARCDGRPLRRRGQRAGRWSGGRAETECDRRERLTRLHTSQLLGRKGGMRGGWVAGRGEYRRKEQISMAEVCTAFKTSYAGAQV